MATLNEYVSLFTGSVDLIDGARAAGDYSNGALVNDLGVVFLTVQYASGPPTAGDDVAKLYLLPGNGQSAEVFAAGGDGSLGSDITPQEGTLIGVFSSVEGNASASPPASEDDEVLVVGPFPLYPNGNRFVMENTSGVSFTSGYQCNLKAIKVPR